MTDHTPPTPPAPSAAELLAALPPKQADFARLYAVYRNAGRAAREAGYSAKTARKIGYNLRHSSPAVKAAIDVLLADRAARLDAVANRVIEELAIVGFSDLDHYQVDDDGRVVLTADAPADAMRAVKKIRRKTRTFTKDDETTTETVTELELHAKLEALRGLGDEAGIWAAKKVHLGDPNGDPLSFTLAIGDTARPLEPQGHADE